MAHQYSVEIHEFLGDNLKKARSALEEAQKAGDKKAVEHQQGRIEELNFFRTMLTEKFDLSNQKYY